MQRIKDRLKLIATRVYVIVRAALAAVVLGMIETFGSQRGRRLLATGALLGTGLLLVLRPPVRVIAPGEVGVRINRLTGGIAVVGEGPAMVLPMLHDLRRYPLRDQVYKPADSARAEGAAPFQTVEGLSVGVSVSVRYALDRDRIADIAKRLPANVGQELIEPVVDGVLHRSLAKHTVREIFTDKRVEIQQAIEQELRGAAGQGRHRHSHAVHRPRRPAGAVPRRPRGAAGRGAGEREDALHAAAQGEAGEGEVAGGGRREDPAREGGRGRRVRADHRRQGARGGDEARAAAEGEGDRAAPPGGGGAQGAAGEGRRGRGRGAQDRSRRRGGLAPQAVRRRRLPHRGDRQGADASRWRAIRC